MVVLFTHLQITDTNTSKSGCRRNGWAITMSMSAASRMVPSLASSGQALTSPRLDDCNSLSASLSLFLEGAARLPSQKTWLCHSLYDTVNGSPGMLLGAPSWTGHPGALSAGAAYPNSSAQDLPSINLIHSFLSHCSSHFHTSVDDFPWLGLFPVFSAWRISIYPTKSNSESTAFEKPFLTTLVRNNRSLFCITV